MRYGLLSTSRKRLETHAKQCLVFLAVGSFFSALDWTLWWFYKYMRPTPNITTVWSYCFDVFNRYVYLQDAPTVLILVYWFKPIGFVGYVCVKAQCIYRVLR